MQSHTSLVHPHTSRIRLLLGALALAITTLMMLLPAAPSHAHDVLLESSITDGSEVATAPAEWSLRFNNEVLAVGSEGALASADGQTIPLDAPKIDRDTVTFTIPALAKGDYTANWRVVSSDGHPISGSINFTVTEGAPAETPTASAAASEAPVASEAAVPASTDAAAPAAPNTQSEGLPMPLMIGAAALGFVVILGAAIAFVMKGRHWDDLPQTTNMSDDREAQSPVVDDTKEN